MKVLIACEYSGIAREAFRRNGHDAWSCDIIPAEDNSPFHIQDDVLGHLYGSYGSGGIFMPWDLIIAHPPCTYLANSGVRWLITKEGYKNENRWPNMISGSMFFKKFQTYHERTGLSICIENPIPHKYAKKYIGEYNQLIQPYQFGHTTSKATCLWLYGLPKLRPTKIIPKEKRTFDIHRMTPGPDRQKNRSRTFSGIAKAMAGQWG